MSRTVNNKSNQVLFGVIAVLLASSGGILFSDAFAANPELFTKVITPEDYVETNSLVVQSEFVTADLTLLDNDIIDITIFDKTYEVTKDNVDVRSDTDYSWFGKGDASVVLTVDEFGFMGSFLTDDGKFKITQVGEIYKVSLLDLSKLPESADPVNFVSYFVQPQLPQSVQDQIDRLERAYNDNHDYTKDDIDVTIDVFVAYTENAEAWMENDSGRVSRSLQNAIDDGNHASAWNDLPVRYNLVGSEDVRYSDTDFLTDLGALANRDRIFDRAFAVADQRNADVFILVTHLGFDNSSAAYGVCGIANDILVKNARDSFAVVYAECLPNYTFTHEIGHLQGAGHNKDARDIGNFDRYTNSEFDYGHGFYVGDFPDSRGNFQGGVRSIMSTDCNPAAFVQCSRVDRWSDPSINFPGQYGNDVAGTAIQNNAKVIFVTGPYISSLAGDPQSYGETNVVGTINLSDLSIVQGETVTIRATFTKAIDDQNPPRLEISDGTRTSTVTMSKTTTTEYVTDYTFNLESGTVTLRFTDGLGELGALIQGQPNGQASFIVSIPDNTPPVITLNPPNPQTIELGIGYTELGATTDDGSPVTINDSAFVDTLGSYTIYYDSEDLAGNEADQVTRTVNVVDTIEPEITTLDQTFEATAVDTPLTSDDYGIATVIDNSGEIITPTNNAPETFSLGNTTITWTAIDSSNNESTATQIITIQDNTLPTFTFIPADIIVEATGERTSIDIGNPTATDIFAVTITNDAPDSFSVGDTQVTWTATDANNNSATATQLITVQEIIQPITTDGTVASYTKITSQTIGTSDDKTIGFGAGDLFGYKSTNMGDLDGNGAEDFATIAFHETNDGISELGDGDQLGNAYLVLMNTDSTIKESHELSNCATVDETRETRTFGESMDYLGIIDGKHLLLISDYHFSTIHALSIDPVDYSHTCSEIKVDGLNGLGWPFTVAGTIEVDNNDDSIPDLIAEVNRGELYVLDLNFVDSNITVTEQIINDALLLRSDPNWNQRNFENVVVADIDGDDSTIDLVLGEPRGDATTNGAIHVAFIDKSSLEIESVTSITFENLEIAVNQNGTPHFGIGLANMGDLNDDGVDDIAVGIEFLSIGNDYSGGVSIMFLNDDGSIKEMSLISNDSVPYVLETADYFGKGLESIDIDGDGFAELVASAHQDDTGGVDAGAVYVLTFDQDTPLNPVNYNLAPTPIILNPTFDNYFTQFSSFANYAYADDPTPAFGLVELPFTSTTTVDDVLTIQNIDFDTEPPVIQEIDIDFDRDTGDVFINWDFTDRIQDIDTCHTKTQIIFESADTYQRSHFLGSNIDTLNYNPIWKAEDVITANGTEVNCVGSISYNQNDFEYNSDVTFSLDMSFYHTTSTDTDYHYTSQAALGYWPTSSDWWEIMSIDDMENYYSTAEIQINNDGISDKMYITLDNYENPVYNRSYAYP